MKAFLSWFSVRSIAPHGASDRWDPRRSRHSVARLLAMRVYDSALPRTVGHQYGGLFGLEAFAVSTDPKGSHPNARLWADSQDARP